MNRCNLVSLSAIATGMGLSLLSSNALAQQKSLKEQLVGSWTFVSCEVPPNATRPPFCVNPSGSLSLDASGRYTQVIAAGDRPKAIIGSNRADVKPEEYKAVAQGFVANFGTWSVNEADKTLTRRLEGALFPSAEGTEQKNSVSLTGDELKFGLPAGGTGTVWRRAK